MSLTLTTKLFWPEHRTNVRVKNEVHTSSSALINKKQKKTIIIWFQTQHVSVLSLHICSHMLVIFLLESFYKSSPRYFNKTKYSFLLVGLAVKEIHVWVQPEQHENHSATIDFTPDVLPYATWNQNDPRRSEMLNLLLRCAPGFDAFEEFYFNSCTLPEQRYDPLFLHHFFTITYEVSADLSELWQMRSQRREHSRERALDSVSSVSSYINVTGINERLKKTVGPFSSVGLGSESFRHLDRTRLFKTEQ